MIEDLPAARRQFQDDPETLVAQALEGSERSNSDIVRWNREPSFVVRADADPRPRVAIVCGGGSGHEPLHTGFVGRGMLDAAVPGGIFASPSMIQVKAATDAVDRGLGVVHVVKNYTGDVINFGLARDLAIEEGLAVETVIVDTIWRPTARTVVPAGAGPPRWRALRPDDGPVRPRRSCMISYRMNADRELAARLLADPPSLDGSWRAGRDRASPAARRRPTHHTRT